jgi:hypothetical protein
VTEVGEAVAISLPEVGSDLCPICGKPPHPDRTTPAKKAGKGCLKSIPKNLGCSQIAHDGALPNYATAAHHLIPAIQCLAAFPRLSQMCDTVGYDVNNGQNGISLPTCGQGNLNKYVAASGKAAKYGKLEETDKQNVAFLIMEGLNLQWHVGHHNWSMDYDTDHEPHPENYDKLVKTKLREFERDAQQEGPSICEPPDESASGSALIAELNALSQEIRGHVVAWQAYFVSAMSCRFALKYRS